MSLRPLYHLARADFLERTRSYGFLITLGIALYVACLFLPPNHSSYATMQIGGHRGLYNSAYLGAVMAILISPFLSLAGFYLVKNAIDRDLRTRVGQILASTPLSKPLYTVGKMLSNFAVLALIVAIVGLAAIGMQFARKEDSTLHLVSLIEPLIFISLPVMFVVAGLAILFEAIPQLRGGIGNVVYFFLWVALLSSPAGRARQLEHSAHYDLFGFDILLPSISQACEAAFPGSNEKGMSIGINARSGGQFWDLSTFNWNGINWTQEIVISRIYWLGVGLGLALVAAIFFRRFDPAREKSKRRTRTAVQDLQQPASDDRVPQPAQIATLHPLTNRPRFSFLFMVRAELRLALHRLNPWWYLVALGLVITALFSPLPVSRGVLVVAWIWPLLIWSAMGTREKHWRTDQLIFSTAHPLRRQLPACWLAGVLIAFATGCGTGIRLLIAGDPSGLAAWITGAFFIASMALALGVWSGSSKLFEILYLLLWYLGPANRVPEIDYMGITGRSLSSSTTILFAVITCALLIFAIAGRRRQLVN
jgi:hypothetical protein